MNMNDIKAFQELDTQNMIGHINDLPDQLMRAWKEGQSLNLPAYDGVKQVIIAGMGGSAIGADLLRAYAAPQMAHSLSVHRGYGLPAWAKGKETLFICSSHSGNTEETLSSFEAAKKQGCQILAISTGGKLAEEAKNSGRGLWLFDHQGQPRTAVGYSFGLLLALFSRLKFINDPAKELEAAVAAMKAQQENLLPEIPDTANSAKRMAGQFIGRWVTIYGAELMAPVAQRWKTQINENAKAQATFEILPEADHNTLEGLMQPEEQFGASMNIFLRAELNHPRNELRAEHTRMAVMLEGQNTDTLEALGDSRLANIWTTLHYGDYCSYYLAMAYGLDPTDVPMLVKLKEKMAKSK
jgi:glucose/mannose-6-phosphate isomerase